MSGTYYVLLLLLTIIRNLEKHENVHEIFNIGYGGFCPIDYLEDALSKNIKVLDLCRGDVVKTYANIK